MKIDLSGPDITQAEIDAVVAVLSTNYLSLGPKLPEFENAFAQYVGRQHAIAVNSGTSALHLCMIALGIGPGDEVITTPFSFIATSNTILMVDAEPVFVDIDPITYNLDPSAAEAAITPDTKAVMPVEVFGNPAHVDTIYQLAQDHNLICIEDSCEALGSVVNGRPAGTLGHTSAFAFYPNKQMTTGEGGVILTDDDHVADLCRSLRNQGRDPGAGWLAHARLGYNYRLSDINCAIGIEQLKRIDSFITKRRQVAQWYQQALADEDRIIVPTEPDHCEMSWFVFVIRLRDEFAPEHRDALLDHLRNQDIGCSNYFSPIHLQPFMVERFGYQPGAFPITEKVAQRTIALPFKNNLTQTEIETVTTAVKTGLDQLKTESVVSTSAKPQA